MFSVGGYTRISTFRLIGAAGVDPPHLLMMLLCYGVRCSTDSAVLIFEYGSKPPPPCHTLARPCTCDCRVFGLFSMMWRVSPCTTDTVAMPPWRRVRLAAASLFANVHCVGACVGCTFYSEVTPRPPPQPNTAISSNPTHNAIVSACNDVCTRSESENMFT